MSIWIIFKLLGSLALLMFGMKSMSEALQKMAGPQLRHVLGASLYRYVDRYAGNGICPVFYGNDSDDGLVRECWTLDVGSGYLSHHGC